MVVPSRDNYEILSGICERYNVQRLDLHNSSSVTGEDLPEAQGELHLLVEYLPGDELEISSDHDDLERELQVLFSSKEVGLLRVDNVRPDYLRKMLIRGRTLLYIAKGRENL